MSTGIEYLDETWNVATGCDAVSEGCRNCWARGVAEGRLRGRFGYDDVDPFAPKFWPDRLDDPLHWRKPRKIGVAFMSDLFHEAFTDDMRDDVFAVMALASRHTFMVLTKRPGRMHRYLLDAHDRINMARHAYGRHIEATWSRSQLLTAYGRSASAWESLEWLWPLPNVWLGVTVENQQHMDRLDVLAQTPAAVRFVSHEPLLGPIDYTGHKMPSWLILGGETGPGARPMHADWAYDVKQQCVAAGVPFLFKQWGDLMHTSNPDMPDETWRLIDAAHNISNGGHGWYRVRKAGGRMLDGREWNESPGGHGMSADDVAMFAVALCDHLMTQGLDRVDALYAVWAMTEVRLQLWDDRADVAEWLCEVTA